MFQYFTAAYNEMNHQLSLFSFPLALFPHLCLEHEKVNLTSRSLRTTENLNRFLEELLHLKCVCVCVCLLSLMVSLWSSRLRPSSTSRPRCVQSATWRLQRFSVPVFTSQSRIHDTTRFNNNNKRQLRWFEAQRSSLMLSHDFERSFSC